MKVFRLPAWFRSVRLLVCAHMFEHPVPACWLFHLDVGDVVANAPGNAPEFSWLFQAKPLRANANVRLIFFRAVPHFQPHGAPVAALSRQIPPSKPFYGKPRLDFVFIFILGGVQGQLFPETPSCRFCVKGQPFSGILVTPQTPQKRQKQKNGPRCPQLVKISS